ncbi:unnamed protein product [Mesocestoides corti]|uniref:Serine-threonine/tyrosine-protein kinase catalytic domain-containing protein n=1 Tax=Mesocestoides corti TaxID=53468 RepID=A0A0R3ULD1_MESCO|nr:unnamed protein product [Mesocestoides corti]
MLISTKNHGSTVFFRGPKLFGDFLVRETSKATSNSYLVRRNRGHRQRRSESPTSTNLWSVSSTSTTVITGGSSSTTSIFPSQSTEDIRSDRCNGVNGKVVVTKMVLSVYWNGHKHFIIQGGDEAAENGSGDLGNRRGGWDLIEYHMRTGKPVTQSSGALLFNPISRPDWQLDNKDVILLEKIGQDTGVAALLCSLPTSRYDLAARNCLLTEERVLKIADFGMAREEHVYEVSLAADHSCNLCHPTNHNFALRSAFTTSIFTDQQILL